MIFRYFHHGQHLITKLCNAMTGKDNVILDGDERRFSVHKRLHLLDTKFNTKCYKRLYVGSTHLSYSEGNQDARAIWSFRNWLFTKFGFDPKTIETRRHPTVNILLKHVEKGNSNCKIGNIDEIQAFLAKEYPDVMVITTSWMGMPIVQQIETMQQSDIVISHPGSDIMNALFLKDKSTIFIPCRKLPIWGIDISNEVRIWFKIFPFMNVVELCGDEDVTYENGLSTINMEHFPKYMGSAVHDWYIQNDLTPP